VKAVYKKLLEKEGEPGENFAGYFTVQQKIAFKKHQELCTEVWGRESAESPLVDVCLLCPAGQLRCAVHPD